MKSVFALSLMALSPLFAQDTQTPTPRQLDYAVMLAEPPVSARFRGSERNGFAALSAREQIRNNQAQLKSRLSSRNIPVTGSSEVLVNAVFVKATREQALDLANLPGVASVSLTPPLRRKMDRAIDLQNVRQAWSSVGGQSQAGAGVRIAVIDSGIDQTHPALTDASMKAPSGFPLGDAAYTTGKVIAARSYISQLTTSDSRFSSPDDFSPRDRVGHGTSLAAIAAGVSVTAPLAQISGIAPRAWLGNYKIFGTPGIHDTTTTAVFVQALEDAYTDGMDIAIVATGTLPFTGPLSGPLDTAAECNQTQIRSYLPANACDVNAYAVEHAVQSGMLVVVAAGNEGCSGFYSCPTLGTINSPGTAASALTVGSIVNGRQIYSKVKANGEEYRGLSGNGRKFTAPLTAPLVDISSVVSGTTACSGAPAGSLAGKIVLLAYLDCATFQQVTSAQDAGAIAVLLYNTTTDTIFPQTYLMSETGIPVEYVGSTAGTALRAAVKANPSLSITIDPALTSVDVGSDVISTTSSRGPSIGLNGLKPEIAAIGGNVYTATQTYDPNGDLWDASGYAGVDGTSYAAAMVAGAAALVKQAHPAFSPAQLKSALVNTASAGVVSDPLVAGLARTTGVGAGKLNAGAAVATNVTASPAVLGFGVIGSALPGAIPVALTNSGSAPVTLTLNVVARDSDSRASVNVSPSSVTIAPGQTQSFNVSMNGAVPSAGTYDGQVNITGGATSLHIPYNYIVSDKIAADTYPIYGDNYFGVVTEQNVFVAFRTIDRFGAPIVNAPVGWQPVNVINQNANDRVTDAYGIAGAFVIEPARPTIQAIDGYLSSSIYWEFYHFVNFQPFIANGIFNAATQQAGSLAPGSYASISGSDFSSNAIIPTTGYLPISLGVISVTFDAPGISVPAPISYVSPTFINVQIPWEMAGQDTATIKVRYHDVAGPSVTLKLAPVSPAYFEYTDSTNSKLSAVAQDVNYVLITSQHAAVRGQPAVLYVNGLGAVDNTPATGQRSSSVTLSRTTATPEITIGGRPAQVLFSGLTPQTIGLYQINIVIPPDSPTGLQPLTLSVNGIAARVSQMAIQ